MRAAVLIFSLTLLACTAGAQEQNPDQLLKAAIDAQQHGDFQTAIRDYRKLLELRPNTIEARVNLGAALAHEGQFDAAIVEYKAALTSAPQKNAILLNLALAYYKKGDLKNARQQLEALHKAQPNELRIAILLGDTYTRMGDAGTAITLLAPLEAANPGNLDFASVYGFALISAGKRREGAERIQKVADAAKSAQAYMLAGSTLLQINEFEQARKDLDAALLLSPKLPGLYTLAGTARDKTGDVKQAELAFREALKINPDDFDANLYLGAILYKRRELDESKIYLDRALKLNPSSSMAIYEGAMLKSASGLYDSAAQDLENLTKNDPKWLEPHVELATLYYKLHRPEDGAKERQVVERMTAEQQAEGPGKR